jgi:hypothetical protein
MTPMMQAGGQPILFWLFSAYCVWIVIYVPRKLSRTFTGRAGMKEWAKSIPPLNPFD